MGRYCVKLVEKDIVLSILGKLSLESIIEVHLV